MMSHGVVTLRRRQCQVELAYGGGRERHIDNTYVDTPQIGGCP